MKRKRRESEKKVISLRGYSQNGVCRNIYFVEEKPNPWMAITGKAFIQGSAFTTINPILWWKKRNICIFCHRTYYEQIQMT
ncbi:hypothetical protein J18TS1_24760 [Oceanobacillus oncorhynchi subsp. incaldanensis]|nr:hypothetical protein J18TS1_24760 [Oceanobacillus oncorhynchi subsp. incaldanensis]